MEVENLVGRRFGMRVVVAFHHRDSKGNYHWTCKCDCGSTDIANGSELRRAERLGRENSCGCVKTIHGMSYSPTHDVWLGMRQRCNNPRQRCFPNYGGRGITICERWNVFGNFLSDMGVRPLGKTLDRMDNNGNYEPGNCRWATNQEQCRNTRVNKMITYKGETKCLIGWAESLGIKSDALEKRLKKMPVERAFTMKYEPRT